MIEQARMHDKVRPNMRGFMNRKAHNTDVVVLAVPHAGLTFMRDALHCHGQYSDYHVNMKKYVGDRTVVVPLRDPEQVWASWQWRNGTGREKHLYPKRDDGRPVDRWKAVWKAMEYIDKKLNPYYVTIDLPEEREWQLQALSQRLGRSIFAGWGWADAYKGPKPEKETELGWIYDLDFMRRFYAV